MQTPDPFSRFKKQVSDGFLISGNIELIISTQENTVLEPIPAASPQVNTRKKPTKSILSAYRSKEEKNSFSLEQNFDN